MTVKQLKRILVKCKDSDIVEISCKHLARSRGVEYDWLEIKRPDYGFIKMMKKSSEPALLLLETGRVMGEG